MPFPRAVAGNIGWGRFVILPRKFGAVGIGQGFPRIPARRLIPLLPASGSLSGRPVQKTEKHVLVLLDHGRQ
jgi:hypothetical protein